MKINCGNDRIIFGCNDRHGNCKVGQCVIQKGVLVEVFPVVAEVTVALYQQVGHFQGTV